MSSITYTALQRTRLENELRATLDRETEPVQFISMLVLKAPTMETSALYERVLLPHPLILVSMAQFLYQCLHVFLMGANIIVRIAHNV